MVLGLAWFFLWILTWFPLFNTEIFGISANFAENILVRITWLETSTYNYLIPTWYPFRKTWLLLKLTHFNESKFKIVKNYQWNLIMVYYVNKNSQKDWLISFKKWTFENWFPHFRLYRVKLSPINTVNMVNSFGKAGKKEFKGKGI